MKTTIRQTLFIRLGGGAVFVYAALFFGVLLGIYEDVSGATINGADLMYVMLYGYIAFSICGWLDEKTRNGVRRHYERRDQSWRIIN